MRKAKLAPPTRKTTPAMTTHKRFKEPSPPKEDAALGREIVLSFLEKIGQEDGVLYHLHPVSSLQFQVSGTRPKLRVVGSATLGYYTHDGKHNLRTKDTSLPIHIKFEIDGLLKMNEYSQEEGFAVNYNVDGLDWNA